MITVSKIEELEKASGLISSMHSELSLIAKKTPNDAVNGFKFKLLNQAILAANELLGDNYKPIEGFELFDEDDFPSSSDAVFVLAQYIAELERMRADNIYRYGSSWYFELDPKDKASRDADGETLKIPTAPPKKVGK